MIPRSKFSSFCRLKVCDKPTVICKAILEDGKICGQQGHPDYYKCDETHLIMVIEHVDFLEDKDKGRNCFHSTGKKIVAPESIKVNTWRTYRGKDRWQKIPKEVKRGLGWE